MSKLTTILCGTAVAIALSLGIATPADAAEMIITNETPVAHWKHKMMTEIADVITKKTEGRVQAKVFPSGQLYNDRDALNALGSGAVHMVWPIAGQFGAVDPRFTITNLPFVLTDELMLKDAFAEQFTALVNSFVEARRIRVLALVRSTDTMFLMRGRVIKKPSDFKGLKVRISAGRELIDTYKGFGLTPVSVAPPDQSTALAQGTIDGLQTSAAAWPILGGAKTLQASYIPGLLLGIYAAAVDDAWFAALSPADRTVIAETVTSYARGNWAKAMRDDLAVAQKIAAEGGVFWTASKEEIQPWRDATAGAAQEFAARHPEVMEKYLALVRQHER